jgi:hypothetical protein
MKKILVLLVASMIAIISTPTKTNAQILLKPLYSKSLAAGSSDTSGWKNVASNLSSLQYTVTKDTGTVAGKVYLEVMTNGKYKKLDSFTLANTTLDQSFFYIPTKTSYLSYRFILVPTGNWSSTITAGGLRRDDDNGKQ